MHTYSKYLFVEFGLAINIILLETTPRTVARGTVPAQFATVFIYLFIVNLAHCSRSGVHQ